jgi:hypothetical protein
MKNSVSVVLRWFLAVLVLAVPAFTQISGSVAGSVHDGSGAAVAKASVVLVNKGTNAQYNTTANEEGEYRFLLIPVGEYKLSGEASGFAKSELDAVVVQLGQATRADLVLRVAGTTSQVEVSGSVVALQTESAAVSGVVDHESIVNLPLNRRNFVQLVALQPNAVPSPRTSFFRNLGGYNVIAGTPVESTAVTIDGVNIKDINDPRINISLNPDVIQEFQEAQSSYSAAQGLGGGGQINLVTKSGTNSFHGSLFEFLRNDKLDAKNYFDVNKPPYRQNQFGGSFGGPIVKNKTFFYAGYEGLRIVKQETFRYTVPTVAQRNGDFSESTRPIYDPLNVVGGLRVPFAGNQIPEDRWAPEAVRALDLLFPLPNQPGTVNNLIGNPPDNSKNDQFSVRIDQKIGAADSLFGRYIYYNYRRVTGIFTALPNFADNFNTPSQNAAIAYIHVFGPRTLNQARFGYHRMTQVIEDVQINEHINDEIGITGTSTNFFGNPNITIAGLNRTGGISNAPNDRSDNGYYFYDDFSHGIGNHSLQIGANFVLEQVNGGINSFARGNFGFRPFYTAQFSSPGVLDSATGQAVADLLLGFPSSSGRGLGVGFRNFRQRRVGVYVADDWKVNNRLTLNLGLRWEYAGPGFEAHDRLSGFDPETASIVLAGEDGFPRGLRDSNWKDFQPRIGMAYRVGDRTVVRAAYGLYFFPLTMYPTPFTNLLNLPFFTSESYSVTPGAPTLTLANAFPSGTGVPSLSLNSVNRHLKDPYLHQWNLAVERELGSNMTLTVGYLGNKGVDLRNSQNINAPAAGPGALQAKRPFPAFSTITSYENIGSSDYNSGFIKIDRRFRGGLTFMSSYTFAKLLDTGGIVSPGDLSDGLGRNPLRPQDERGRSFFDARHRFVASYVWQLPFGKGRYIGKDWSGVMDRVLGQWQVNGIVTLQSGLPLTPVLATDHSNTGLFTDRPNVIGDPNDGPRTRFEWFNTAAFEAPTDSNFSYGNAGRNIIDGPPIKTVDFSLFKGFGITEGTSLEFRTEFFNVFNHPNFDPPGTTFGTASFGSIPSAGDSRQIQFGLKFLF